MFLRIIKNDFKRKKIITGTVFVFITLAVFLGASATNIIANLYQSISEFQEEAEPADITQMHAGNYNQKSIDEFTKANPNHIAMQETMELLTVDGVHIQFGGNKTFAGTVQDISFVVQNEKFDFILDLNNQKLDVSEGEVAVPIYFMEEYDLEIGETITVVQDAYEKQFLISEYARDYEMNSALTSSKRFVINQVDYEEMQRNKVGESEYLIQFKLKENGNPQRLQTAYINAGLPANGPTVTGGMFLLFNALSDATFALIIILISILLIIIATLCIRMTFLATMDEDLREIGVMKAIGLPNKDIKKVYLNKYRVMSIAAGVIGYFLSFIGIDLLSSNMRLYLSSDLSGNLKYFLSLVAPLFVYFMIVMYCKKILKEIDRIPAIEALRSNILKRGKNHKYRLPLLQNNFFSTNIYMGIRDVWNRFKLYRLLILIFAVCTFIVILPLNIYNTINSPDFSTYMGIGKSDIRIDLRRTDTIREDFQKLQEELKSDHDIEKFAAYSTSTFPVENVEGTWDYLNIETGDFSVFPLNYLEGKAPNNESEISLSYANASSEGLNKTVGDEVVVDVAGKEKILEVSGIYQDITNGGKTAKAHSSLGINEDAVIWTIVYLDLKEGVDKYEKKNHYQNLFSAAQVNDMKDYTQQTLGNMVDQLTSIVLGSIVIAGAIITLITALFMKMLLSKDLSQIAIMRSLGLTSKQIELQYISGTLMVLVIGLILGLLASEFLGEFLFSLGMSSLGAVKIEFIQIIWQNWLMFPLALIVLVGVIIISCCKTTIKKDLSVILKG